MSNAGKAESSSPTESGTLLGDDEKLFSIFQERPTWDRELKRMRSISV
jgi:hypothetical protein